MYQIINIGLVIGSIKGFLELLLDKEWRLVFVFLVIAKMINITLYTPFLQP